MTPPERSATGARGRPPGLGAVASRDCRSSTSAPPQFPGWPPTRSSTSSPVSTTRRRGGATAGPRRRRLRLRGSESSAGEPPSESTATSSPTNNSKRRKRTGSEETGAGAEPVAVRPSAWTQGDGSEVASPARDPERRAGGGVVGAIAGVGSHLMVRRRHGARVDAFRGVKRADTDAHAAGMPGPSRRARRGIWARPPLPSGLRAASAEGGWSVGRSGV